MIDSSCARLQELFFPRNDDHAARIDRVRLALESTEHRIYGKAHARQQPGHFGERVEPDDMSDRLVAASLGIDHDKVYVHAARREVQVAALDVESPVRTGMPVILNIVGDCPFPVQHVEQQPSAGL